MTELKNEKYHEERDLPILIHNQSVRGIGMTAKVHYHDYIEILYTYGGSYNIWLDGKYYEFGKGDLVVINSQEVHCINSLEDCEGAGYLCLRFTPEILTDNSQIFTYKFVMPFLTNHKPPQKVFRENEIEKTPLPELMSEIYNEYSKQEYAHELAIYSDICKIFVWILRYWKSEGLESDNKINVDLSKKLQNVMDYISKNYSNPISAQDMAKLSNMSYSYFSRSFKTFTNRSFSEHLNFLRITEAEKLLLTTDMNITEIAMQVGFSTSSYFIRQFKLYKNRSPKQFKNAFSK